MYAWYNMPADQSAYPAVLVSGLGVASFKIITTLAQLPAPVGGIIYLPANSSWQIVGTIDLAGNRLVTQGAVTITGNGRGVSVLLSTGLPAAAALFTTSYVASLRELTMRCPVGCSILNITGATNAFFAYHVGFGDGVASGKAGTFSGTLTNVLLIECVLTNVTDGFTFTGTISSAVFEDCLFSSTTLTGSYVTLAAALTITTRFRASGTVFRVFSGGTGLTDLAATIPISSLILLLCSFSGAGTFLSGINYSNIETKFVDNSGITNTVSVAQLSMTNNVTATTLTGNTWTPILGTVSVLTLERFTHLNRVVTYLDTGTNPFLLNWSFSLSTGNNQEIEATFSKNGVAQTQFSAHITSTGNGTVSSTAIFGFVQLTTNDTVGLMVKNLTSGSSITIEHMILIVTQVANT